MTKVKCVRGRLRMRGDNGRATELGPEAEFLKIDDKFYSLAWIRGSMGILPSQIEITATGDSKGASLVPEVAK